MKKLLLNESFILILILVNAILIFIQGFNLPKDIQASIEVFDHTITLIFIAEVIIKIIHFGKKGYFSSNWNRLDFILVLCAIPSLIFYLLPITGFDLKFLLALRLLRVFKFFRFFRFLPNIDRTIAGVTRAIKASLLIIISFFVFIFSVALVSNFFFKEIAPESFGNPLLSIYSTFKIFTIEGWFEIPDAIAESQPNYLEVVIKIYFSTILLVGGIFGLSIVNSIFVDAMVADNNQPLESKIDDLKNEIQELKNIIEGKKPA